MLNFLLSLLLTFEYEVYESSSSLLGQGWAVISGCPGGLDNKSRGSLPSQQVCSFQNISLSQRMHFSSKGTLQRSTSHFAALFGPSAPRRELDSRMCPFQFSFHLWYTELITVSLKTHQHFHLCTHSLQTMYQVLWEDTKINQTRFQSPGFGENVCTSITIIHVDINYTCKNPTGVWTQLDIVGDRLKRRGKEESNAMIYESFYAPH